MKYLSLIIKNLLRNSRRTLLTLLALAISFFLYCAIFTLIAGMYQRLNQENAGLNLILRPLYMASFIDPKLPTSYLERVRSMPLTYATTPYKVYVGEGLDNTVFVLGIDPLQIQKIRRLALRDASSLEWFRKERQGALVGEVMMEQNRWKVGERVILKGVRGNPALSLKIAGVMDNKGDFGAAVLVDYDYLKSVMNDGAMSIVFFRAKEAYQVPWLIRATQLEFESAPVPIEVITEKTFLRSVLSELEGVVSAIQIIAWVTIAATICIVGNTISMSIRERKREIGVFRTLGFSQWILFLLFLAEAMILSAAGGILGAGVAWAIFAIADIRISAGVGSSEISILPQFEPVLQSILLALAVGIVSGVIPALRFSRRPITENLASVD